MTDLSPFLLAALTLAGGVLLGLAHFASLAVVTRLFLDGRQRGRAVALQLARMAVAVAVFSGFALAGALPLLSGALGFLIGRAIVLRRSREGTR